MSEAELQSAILDLARWEGYLTFHVRDSRKSTGPGFPDLVLVHQRTGRLLFRELKTDVGKLTAGQEAWLDALRAGGHDADVWRTADWHSGRIQQDLHHARKAVA